MDAEFQEHWSSGSAFDPEAWIQLCASAVTLRFSATHFVMLWLQQIALGHGGRERQIIPLPGFTEVQDPVLIVARRSARLVSGVSWLTQPEPARFVRRFSRYLLKDRKIACKQIMFNE
ncbi:MAG: hypothetical protein ACRD72_06465 [Candidatus Angelobacter sp.]